MALNQLWKLHFPIDQLTSIGLRLGADVPVFVRGRTAWGEGVGNLLTPLSFSLQDSLSTSPNYFLVVKPDCEVSTAMVFSHKRLTRDTPKRKIAPAVELIDQSFRNDCQAVVSETYDKVRQALEWLKPLREGQTDRNRLLHICRIRISRRS
jgi:4-diphosphocytidyl-2-C-methyl-D-erythritol kinase